MRSVKQQIIFQISDRLSRLGVPFQNGNGTDITILTEFLDAGWSTGSKKISYMAYILADEKENVIYMYEKTTEIGQGVSFGFDEGSSFQSGMTLFRKVKSIQYSPDGKVYAYNLNLGSIAAAVKDTASAFGWKFKTVLNKNKAMYEPASPPNQSGRKFCTYCGTMISPVAKFCNRCGKQVI